MSDESVRAEDQPAASQQGEGPVNGTPGPARQSYRTLNTLGLAVMAAFSGAIGAYGVNHIDPELIGLPTHDQVAPEAEERDRPILEGLEGFDMDAGLALLQAYRQSADRIGGTVSGLDGQIEALDERLAVLDQLGLSELEDRLAAIAEEAGDDEEVAALEEEVADLQRERETLSGQHDELRRERDNLQAQLSTLRERNDGLESDLEQVQAALEEAESTGAEQAAQNGGGWPSDWKVIGLTDGAAMVRTPDGTNVVTEGDEIDGIEFTRVSESDGVIETSEFSMEY